MLLWTSLWHYIPWRFYAILGSVVDGVQQRTNCAVSVIEHSEEHGWEPMSTVSQHISYRIAALVWWCLTVCAPSYVSDLCRPGSDLASCRALCSSDRVEFLVPWACSVLKQCRALSVIGSSIWLALTVQYELIMSPDICWMFCFGFLFGSVSSIESPLWSGGANLALHLST